MDISSSYFQGSEYQVSHIHRLWKNLPVFSVAIQAFSVAANSIVVNLCYELEFCFSFQHVTDAPQKGALVLLDVDHFSQHTLQR